MSEEKKINCAGAQTAEEKSVFDILKDNPQKDAIINALCEMIAKNGRTEDAEIEDVTEDDESFLVDMYASTHMEDDGIGAYEFWGSAGVDHRYVPELDNVDAFDFRVEQGNFEDIGLGVSVGEPDDPEYGEGCEDNVGATSAVNVWLTVKDEAIFKAWISGLLSEKAA